MTHKELKILWWITLIISFGGVVVTNFSPPPKITSILPTEQPKTSKGETRRSTVRGDFELTPAKRSNAQASVSDAIERILYPEEVRLRELGYTNIYIEGEAFYGCDDMGGVLFSADDGEKPVSGVSCRSGVILYYGSN